MASRAAKRPRPMVASESTASAATMARRDRSRAPIEGHLLPRRPPRQARDATRLGAAASHPCGGEQPALGSGHGNVSSRGDGGQPSGPRKETQRPLLGGYGG